MQFKWYKLLAAIGSILGLIAAIPIDSLAWWRWDATVNGQSWPNWLDPYNQFHFKFGYDLEYSIATFDNLYFYVGVLTIAGSLLMILGGILGKKFVIAFGLLVLIAGPLEFVIAHVNNYTLTALLHDAGNNLFFGTYSTPGYSWNWYLSTGFYLPVCGSILGLVSLVVHK